MREFNVLRACFYLLAVVMLIAMVETLLGLTSCAWILIMQERSPDSCGNIGQNVREVFSELLTAILALIVAARSGRDD